MNRKLILLIIRKRLERQQQSVIAFLNQAQDVGGTIPISAGDRYNQRQMRLNQNARCAFRFVISGSNMAHAGGLILRTQRRHRCHFAQINPHWVIV